MFRNIAKKILERAGHFSKRFITVHTRPIYTKDMPYQGKENPVDGACAIVIQGPIKREYDFTVESVKLYRKHYPSATIILSTWKDEDVSAFETFKGEKFKVVQSEDPSYPGPGNMNRQLVSTMAGIQRAKNCGLHYVAKTRTDQRLYSIGALEFMKNLTDYFPLSSNTLQKKRIVGWNVGTTVRYTPYHLSDLFMFGTTEDMQIYWGADLIYDKTIDPKKPLVERRLFINFLRATGWDIKETPEDSMKALGERVVVVGNESLDLYWPKYYEQHREYRLRDYRFPNNEISFKEWLTRAFIPKQKRDKCQD